MENVGVTKDFLEGFDIICLQETWLEDKNKDDVLNKLVKIFKSWAKAAVQENVRGRVGGGHLVGIKKSISPKCNVEK